MADPRASIKIARSLGIGPPLTVGPIVAPTPEAPAESNGDAGDIRGTEINPESEKHQIEESTAAKPAKRQPGTKAKPTSPVQQDEVNGIEPARSRRVRAIANLPSETRDRLNELKQGSTIGATIMDALRTTYPWLTENYGLKKESAVGPFPAPSKPRRRVHVTDAVHVPFTLTQDEDVAIDRVANECEMSRSELITLAVDRVATSR